MNFIYFVFMIVIDIMLIITVSPIRPGQIKKLVPPSSHNEGNIETQNERHGHQSNSLITVHGKFLKHPEKRKFTRKFKSNIDEMFNKRLCVTHGMTKVNKYF